MNFQHHSKLNQLTIHEEIHCNSDAIVSIESLFIIEPPVPDDDIHEEVEDTVTVSQDGQDKRQK